MTRSQPLEACKYCMGSVGKLHPHEQLPRTKWRPLEKYENLLSREFLEVCEKDVTADDGCLRSHEVYPAK